MLSTCSRKKYSSDIRQSYKTFGICDVSKINLYGNKVETLNWSELSVPEVITIPECSHYIEYIDSVFASVKVTSAKLIETPISNKYYAVALLDENGNPIYENGQVLQSSCSTAFQIQSNEEGTCLTGRKLVITGCIKQKIIYVSSNSSNPMHAIESSCPFQTYIIVYPKFTNVPNQLTDITIIDPLNPSATDVINGYYSTSDDPIEIDLCEEFCINVCIEDIFVKVLDPRTIFKNITLFLSSSPASAC